jgi:hypothetical protein
MDRAIRNPQHAPSGLLDQSCTMMPAHSVLMRMRVFVFAHRMHLCVRACVCACVHARAHVRACVRVRVRVRVCMPTCVRPLLRKCLCVHKTAGAAADGDIFVHQSAVKMQGRRELSVRTPACASAFVRVLALGRASACASSCLRLFHRPPLPCGSANHKA